MIADRARLYDNRFARRETLFEISYTRCLWLGRDHPTTDVGQQCSQGSAMGTNVEAEVSSHHELSIESPLGAPPGAQGEPGPA